MRSLPSQLAILGNFLHFGPSTQQIVTDKQFGLFIGHIASGKKPLN